MKSSNIETIYINKEDFKTLSRLLNTYKLLVIIWRMPISYLKELLEFCEQELNESKIYLKNARKRRPHIAPFYRKDIQILKQNMRQIKQIIALKNKKRKAPDFISDIDFTTFMSELQINYKTTDSNTNEHLLKDDHSFKNDTERIQELKTCLEESYNLLNNAEKIEDVYDIVRTLIRDTLAEYSENKKFLTADTKQKGIFEFLNE